METALLYAAAIALSALFAWICATLAKRRGASPVYWGVMGFMFGPLAVPFVFLARREKTG